MTLERNPLFEPRVRRVLDRDTALSELEVRSALLSQEAIRLGRESNALARKLHKLSEDIAKVNDGGPRG